MASRYTRMIALLGVYDTGKTCYLLSLYLMACRARLPQGYIFAGSETLVGFEERAWRIREWSSGELPEQLADHTSVDGHRQAGFLHLAVREASGLRRRHDFLLTDLPGEWTKTLIESSAGAQRFDFLSRADGIVLVVDGERLSSSSRHVEISRTRLLITRLVSDIKIDKSTPFVILLSKCDAIGMKSPDAAAEILAHAEQAGLRPKLILSASFSRNPKISSGAGVFDPLQLVIDAAPLRLPAISPSNGSRIFLKMGTVS
jgi:hypothetical protein